MGLCSICFNGTKIWNSIHPEIGNATSVGIFKKNLKISYLTLIFPSIFVGHWGFIWCRGVYFLPFCPQGPWDGVFPGFTFSAGAQQKSKKAFFCFLCPGGELGG